MQKITKSLLLTLLLMQLNVVSAACNKGFALAQIKNNESSSDMTLTVDMPGGMVIQLYLAGAGTASTKPGLLEKEQRYCLKPGGKINYCIPVQNYTEGFKLSVFSTMTIDKRSLSDRSNIVHDHSFLKYLDSNNSATKSVFVKKDFQAFNSTVVNCIIS